MSSQGLTGASNSANLVSGLSSSVAAFQSNRNARKAMNEQADFIERTAEQEAQLILQAGDERLAAFSARGQAFLEEEGLNRFVGEARAREARETGRTMISTIQARSAAKGIMISEGSPLELAAEAAFESEKQAANEELETRLRSENLLTRAKEEFKSGQAARFAAQMKARSTILTSRARAVGIRTQAPSTGDILSSLTRPLGSLDADTIEAGIQPFKGLFNRQPQPILMD